MGVTAKFEDVSDPVAAPGRFGTRKIDGRVCQTRRLQDSDPDPLQFIVLGGRWRGGGGCRVGQFVNIAPPLASDPIRLITTGSFMKTTAS